MPPDIGLRRPEPLPVEQILFDTPLVRVGSFRCPTEHRLFANSGPIVNPIFVFPRQTYRRKPLSDVGDHCEWFALAPGVLAEIASVRDARAIEHLKHPFAQ